jgi:hypothetical protein
MTDALQTIGQRIWGFLSQALDGRDPDRDVPAARAILRDLVDAISGPGLTRARWDADLVRIVDVPVKALLRHPARWNEAVKLTAIYFATEWRDEHPFADASVARGVGAPDRPTQHPVRVHLDILLLEQLLARAAEESRLHFLSNFDERAVTNSLKSILPRLDLSFQDMVALVQRVESLGDQDLWMGSFYEAVLGWSEIHADTGKQIADAWLARSAPASSLSSDALLALVRGAVLGSGDLEWRDQVLGILDAFFSDETSRLAVFVVNLAWPRSRYSDVQARHEFLISWIRRRPELLVETGIRAMFGDAVELPLETLETALALWRLLPESSSEQTRQHAAMMLIECGGRAVASAKKKELPLGEFLQLLEVAVIVPIVSVNDRLSRLDFLLEDLVEAEEGSIRRFLARWLLMHGAAVIQSDASLEELFPLLVQKGPERATAWLLSFMISSDRELGEIAAILFGRHRTTALPRHFLERLDKGAASALAYMLAGNQSLPGEIWIPCLIEMARVRLDLLELIEMLLLEDAGPQYPAELRRVLGRWSESPWSKAAQTIANRLDRARDEWQLRHQIPELSYRPAGVPWFQREQQALGEAVQRGQGRSVFMRFVMKVPIARGEASSWAGAPDRRVPFNLFQSSVEFPMLEILDPVAARLRRLARRRQAEKLIAMMPESADA